MTINPKQALAWEVYRVRSIEPAPKPMSAGFWLASSIGVMLLIVVVFTLLDKFVQW